MPTLPMTDYSVQKVSCLDKAQVRFTFSGMPGFGIIVGKRKKTFFVITGKDRKLTTLGRYPAITLKDARKKALLILDGYPQAPQPQLPGLRIKEYLLQVDASQRYKYEQRRLLERHLLPYVKDLRDVTKADVLRILDSLVKTPSEQLHAFRAMRAFFKFCAARDYIQTSPVAGLEAPGSDKTRDVVLAPAQLNAGWHRAPKLGPYGLVIRLCMLLATRKGEISAIVPSWIGDGTLTIPPQFTKNRREHVLPLSPAAKHYATQLATGEKPNWNSWNKIKRQTGFRWLRLHDIRRTHATICAELGVPIHVIERILNHVTGEATPLHRRYNHYRYQREVKAALQKYEKRLAKILGAPLI